MATSFNGYTNYATWNVCLHVDNDYKLYTKKVEWVKSMAGSITAETVRHFYARLLHGSTPDLDRKVEGMRWNDVNWQEVADELNIEAKELTA